MTLLILPLMDAATDLGVEDNDASLSAYFSDDNAPTLMSFALSFFAVTHVWVLGDPVTRDVGCAAVHR